MGTRCSSNIAYHWLGFRENVLAFVRLLNFKGPLSLWDLRLRGVFGLAKTTPAPF